MISSKSYSRSLYSPILLGREEQVLVQNFKGTNSHKKRILQNRNAKSLCENASNVKLQGNAAQRTSRKGIPVTCERSNLR